MLCETVALLLDIFQCSPSSEILARDIHVAALSLSCCACMARKENSDSTAWYLSLARQSTSAVEATGSYISFVFPRRRKNGRYNDDTSVLASSDHKLDAHYIIAVSAFSLEAVHDDTV